MPDITDKRLQLSVGQLIHLIDNMSYSDMLFAWRHLPKNDVYFLGEIGERFKEQMERKKARLSEVELKRIDRFVGKGRFK